MSIQKAIAIELEREKENTIRILKALPEDQFGYKPHEKSMSLGELANHIVELHNWVAMTFTTDVFDFHTDYAPLKLNTVSDLVAEMENGHQKNLQVVNELTDEAYMSSWTMQAGSHVVATMPKSGAYRFIVANHLIHHRGQLTVYLRLLNVPLPGIYGPSADEQGK